MNNSIFNNKMDELLNFGSFEELEKEIEKITLQITEIEKRKTEAGNLDERLSKVAEELEINTALLKAGKIKASESQIYELSKEYVDLTNLQKEVNSLQPIKGKLKILNKAKELWEEKIKNENSLLSDLKEVEESLQNAQKELYDLGNRILNKDFDFANLDRMLELQTNIIPSLEEKYKNLKNNNREIKTDSILPNDIKDQVKQYMLDIVSKNQKKDIIKIKLITNKNKAYTDTELFIKVGEALEMPENPVLDDNHEFECWLLNGEPYDFSKPLTEDITLEAKYREKQKVMRVTLVTDKTKPFLNTDIFWAKGTPLRKPIDPVLDDNHEFEYWLLNGEPYDFSKPLTEDITLEAKYREKQKIVRVTLVTDKTKPFLNTDIFWVKGTPFKKPIDPVLDDNHEFEYWLLNGEPYDFSKPLTEDITLEAKYREKTKAMVSVKFNENNNGRGINLTETFLVTGEILDKPQNPVLDEDHEFVCWLLDGEPYDFTKPVTKDIILEAKYKEKEIIGPKVLVAFNLHYGAHPIQDYNPIKLNRGDSLKSIESPILDDHEFECWLLDGKPFDLNTPINEDIVLEAKYKSLQKDDNKVSVSFKLNNGSHPIVVYDDVKLDKGTLLERPEDPTLIDKDGNTYELEYWMVGGKRFWFNTPIEEDIVLEAKYKEQPKKDFEIKFALAGGGHDSYLFDPITLKDGELLLRPEDPILDDEHVFDCWMLDDQPYDFSKPVKKDMILTAKYKSRYETNTITFKNKRGKVIKTVEVISGEKIKASDMPKPKHKMLKLSSWKNGENTIDVNTVITEDMEVIASYKKDWKKIAALGAGVAAGAMAKVIDTALFNTPGVFSSVSVGVNIVASRITTKKLKNHKAVDTAKVETLKGIKKANSKLVNYFRDEKNIKDLRTFFRTAAITSGISLYSELLELNAQNDLEREAANNYVNSSENQGNVIDYFEVNDPDYIFDTANDAVNNIDPEASAGLFEGSDPARAYNPNNGSWFNINENTTFEEIEKALGTDNPLFDFQKNGTSTGWVDLENSYNIGGR